MAAQNVVNTLRVLVNLRRRSRMGWCRRWWAGGVHGADGECGGAGGVTHTAPTMNAVGQAEYMAPTMNAQEVASTLTALARLGAKPSGGLIRALEGRTQAVKPSMNRL